MLAVVSRDPEQRELEARAARVFQLEQQSRGKVPAHEIRALSMAITFHDHKGAEQILTKLERSL